MDWTTGLYALIGFTLVLLNGFFVLAEFALVKVRATRVEELAREGSGPASVAREMVIHLDRYLSAAQLGITLASLGLGWVGERAAAQMRDLAAERNDQWTWLATPVVLSVLTFLVITFMHISLGEQAPKMLAIHRPERSTLVIAYPLQWFYRLFYLPMRLLNGASNLLLKPFGLGVGHGEVVHTEQELRMLLSSAQTRGGFSLNRLLILENIFDLGTQTVQDAMIPWSRVRHLLRSASRDEVMRELTEHKFSRTPVLDAATGMPKGYLLTKDLIVQPSADADWTRLIRPLRVVAPGDNLELTMQQLQQDGANMAVVMDGSRPVGLITLEDILEEIVGRIEDEFPRLPRLFLKDTIAAGGVVLDLEAQTAEEAIRKLAASIPIHHLPEGADVAGLALARERQMSTDMGSGVAIPHARCRGLTKPLIVFGRSAEGIKFSETATDPVRLIFLLVTPAERPNLQVFCLAQLASIAQSEFVRERLYRATTPQDLLDIIAAADPAVTG